MKQLIGSIGDRLQAIFPPNRICILLATPILAASAWISATVTGNVPGVDLPVGVVSGVMGVIVFTVATLLYKWFDQWQKGEPIHIGADLESLIDELESKLVSSLGAHEAVEAALADLYGKISRGEVNEVQVANSLEVLYGVIGEVLAEHHGGHPEPIVSPAIDVTPGDAAEGVVPADAAEGAVPSAAAPETPAQ